MNKQVNNGSSDKGDEGTVVEYKQSKANQSGKEGAKDAPHWAKGRPPSKKETPNQYAKRLMDEQYGEGGWDTQQIKKPKSEYQEIYKYFRKWE
ncbi:MAG: hypothetical protein ACOYMA_07510 [Bacteroidia bacterium]